MKKPSLFMILSVLLVLLLSGCVNQPQPLPQDDRLTVYTSIYPLYDFTKKIGGDRVIVINVIPLGAQSHSSEPSTRMVADLSQAKVFIYNGAGMEHYLPKLALTLEATGVKLVNTSIGVSLLKNVADEHHDEGAEGKTTSEEYDPHIWLSPTRAVVQAQAIYQALAELDPKNATYYEANLHILRQELTSLDEEFRVALTKCPQKELVVSHAAFAYLTEDYGLRQVSLLGVNAEAEPGPTTLKNTIQFIKQQKLQYVFWDPLDSSKLVQTLSEETGAKVLPLNSLGAMSEKDLQEGQDYLSVMRTNLANLQKGLGSQS